jgi:type II secretory pathway pseudopilin PulG
MKQPASSAFSLVELTLAIGLISLCLVAVIGLIPVGVQTNRNATSQTAATNIITAVVADLRATPKANSTSAQFGIIFGTTPRTLYFDNAGEFSCDSAGVQKFNPVTGSCTDSWSPPLQLRYRLTITWSGCSGLCYGDLKMTWPAAADPLTTAPSGSVETFAAFDRN